MAWVRCEHEPTPNSTVDYNDSRGKQEALRKVLEIYCDEQSCDAVYDKLSAMPDGDKHFLHIYAHGKEIVILLRYVSVTQPPNARVVVQPSIRTKDHHRPVSISFA